MKSDRQTAILTLIQEYEIETQEELAEKLQQAGYQVTQATVSRDIRELRLTKVVGESGTAQIRWSTAEKRGLRRALQTVHSSLTGGLFECSDSREYPRHQNGYRNGHGSCRGAG